jgi:hypothetical protein
MRRQLRKSYVITGMTSPVAIAARRSASRNWCSRVEHLQSTSRLRVCSSLRELCAYSALRKRLSRGVLRFSVWGDFGYGAQPKAILLGFRRDKFSSFMIF